MYEWVQRVGCRRMGDKTRQLKLSRPCLLNGACIGLIKYSLSENTRHQPKGGHLYLEDTFLSTREAE